MGYRRKKPRHTIELEIFESGGCGYHKAGDKLKYPEDRGIMCPWLLDSANSMIRVLQFGGTLPWTYKALPTKRKSTQKAQRQSLFVAQTQPPAE